MVESVSATEVAELLRPGAEAPVLLDVREPDERETARIEPSIHVPMGEVVDRLSEIPRDRKVVVYCHHGNRSLAVAGYLESVGFRNVANLSGGIDAWSRLVDPKVPQYD